MFNEQCIFFFIVILLLFVVAVAEKFRFSAEFIEMRRQALDVFVNRIASHGELQRSFELRTFLQADEEVMVLRFVVLNGSFFFPFFGLL